MMRTSILVLLSSAMMTARGIEAAEVAGAVIDDRPPTVPAHYVITPHGYFHPDCVIELKDGESVSSSGHVATSDGRLRTISRCLFPHFHRNGRAASSAPNPPVAHSYIAFTQMTGGFSARPASFITAQWAVPMSPPVQSNQIVYLFPGFEPPTGDTILQPVLGWNQNGSGWSIASWNCCVANNVTHSGFAAVSSGQTITGTVAGTGCDAATGVCSNWQVTTSSSGGAQVVLNTTSYGEQLTLTLGGALEIYNIDSCSKYPANNGASFTNVYVRDINGNYLTQPSWDGVLIPVTPSCQYDVEWAVITPFPSGSAPSWSRTDISWCAPRTLTQACVGGCGTTQPDGCGSQYQCPACSCPGGSRMCPDGSCVKPPGICE